MLRYFTIENWKSFGDVATLDMVATREQRDHETLARTARPSARILPVAALFGANAAGKSSLIEALASLKDIIVKDRPDNAALPVIPCRFAGRDDPTTFEVEFVTVPGDLVYRYSLQATKRRIIRESLIRVRATVETTVFARLPNEETVLADAVFRNNDVVKFVDTVEDNETLLRRIGARFAGLPEVEDITRSFNWFRRTLQIVTPDSRHRYLPIEIKADEVFRDAMNQKLTTADTGIVRVDFEELGLNQLELDPEEYEEFRDALLREGGSVAFNRSNGNIDLLSVRGDDLIAERVVAVHENTEGEEYSLMLAEESDGTVRYFDLLPMVMELDSPTDSVVYVVDELDRSMHVLLLREIVESFLDTRTKDTRSQLIFSTHVASLLHSNLLRRDEIWFAQKSSLTNSSKLVRVSDLSSKGIRDSTDLFSAFIAGQLPGTPKYNAW